MFAFIDQEDRDIFKATFCNLHPTMQKFLRFSQDKEKHMTEFETESIPNLLELPRLLNN